MIGPVHIHASEIIKGDVIVVPGAYLHDDLAGLVCEIKVQQVDRTQRVRWNSWRSENVEYDDIVTVTHSEGRSRTWFYAHEPLRRVAAGVP